MSDTDFNGSHILLHETASVAKLLMKNYDLKRKIKKSEVIAT